MIDPELISGAGEGFLLGASLIIAIGAQNAFVLRQGLQRQHVLAVATVCARSDAVLIAAGVAGLGTLVGRNPGLLMAIAIVGAAFLVVYGALAGRRVLHPAALRPAGQSGRTLAATLATCLGLTFLNPHVYLDTVVLIGGLSARHAPPGAVAFAIGAALASAIWFYGLAYGARLLAPPFAQPVAWRLLDATIAMWAIAARLICEATA
jgi:L-lysine exporter family protein LysE/ArgO